MNTGEIDENLPFVAAYEDNPDAISEAAKFGIDLNESHPRSGHTPLQAACEANSIKAIKALLTCGVDPNKRFTKVSRIDGHIICNNSVALMEARSVEAGQLLLDAGADVSLLDADNRSAIDWARYRKLHDLERLLSSRKIT